MSYPETSEASTSLRRGMKLGEGSRPGTVIIVAKASAGEDDGGRLEVPESEYLAFEEAERIKNSTDPNITPEQKALASINARKFLNKWRERWATSRTGKQSEGGHPSGSSRRRRKTTQGGADGIAPSAPGEHLGEANPPHVGYGSTAGERDGLTRDSSESTSHEMSDVPSGPLYSMQNILPPNVNMQHDQHMQNTHSGPMFHDSQTVLLQNLVTLEAGQSMLLQRLTALEGDTQERLARLEANMAAMQANQANIENGVLRILDALRRQHQ